MKRFWGKIWITFFPVGFSTRNEEKVQNLAILPIIVAPRPLINVVFVPGDRTWLSGTP